MSSDDSTSTDTVDVVLGGKTYVLRPTLQAMKTVNRMMTGNPGYLPTLQAVRSVNKDVFAGIIVAGTGATGSAAEAIEMEVYRADADALIAPLVEFLSLVIDGGRRIPERVAA